MATDEDKCKIAKLLQGLEVPEVKLSERCNNLVREFHKKFDGDMNIEEMEADCSCYENPYVPDKELLEENEKKLKELLADSKRYYLALTELKWKWVVYIVRTADDRWGPMVLEWRPRIGKRSVGSGQYIERPDSRQCFLRCLAELRNLRVLALEYAHIADGSGYALLSLLPVIRRPHFRLQLICREDQIPGRVDAALGVGGHDIPDTVWRRVAIACPDLYLFMAFYRIRDYDNVRRFLTPSIPLRESHLQLGIDLNVTQRQDSDLSCFIRHLGYRYAGTLVTLSIQQWRSVEVPLRRILELMPRLTRLLYTGRVNAADVHDALIVISCGVCDKLKQLKIQIQDEGSKEAYWKMAAEKLTEEFKDIMKLYDIDFCMQIYKA